MSHLNRHILRSTSVSPRHRLIFGGDFVSTGPMPRHWLDSSLAAAVSQTGTAVVNFEGVTDHESPVPALKSGPSLTMHASAAQSLAAAGFHVALLANNHIMDFGARGLDATIDSCKAAGLVFTGAGSDLDSASQPVYRGESPYRAAILAFCERECNVGGRGEPGAAWVSDPIVARRIAEARKNADIVVVCAHGGNELMPLPSPQRRQQLRELIELGADLVIGHHAHVPQGWEPWGDGFIFYGLGDFYFDSPGHANLVCRNWSFLVEVTVGDGPPGIAIIPFERKGNRICHQDIDFQERLDVLRRLSAITAGESLHAYWQELAIERVLAEYGIYLRLTDSVTPPSGIKGRLRRTRDLAMQVLQTWGLAAGPDPARTSTRLRATANLVRCESHRWAVDTAFSVLGGQDPDCRTQAVRRDLFLLRAAAGYPGFSQD